VNFLAHLYLAGPEPQALLGSLMGDFVKGPLAGRYPEPLARALVLHRRIDSYTDTHPVVQRSRARIAAPRRRYAGILIDMFYDHFLARDWTAWSPDPLDRFAARVYALLHEHFELLPERLRSIAPRMAQADWLGSYAHVEAIHEALDRMGERLRRGNALLGAAAELTNAYAAFESDFNAFFPELVSFAEEERRAHRDLGISSRQAGFP
jgi:acyl carrier protein phosphodiesterase